MKKMILITLFTFTTSTFSSTYEPIVISGSNSDRQIQNVITTGSFNGTLDPSFGQNTTTVIPGTLYFLEFFATGVGNQPQPFSAVLQTNGNILLAGASSSPTNNQNVQYLTLMRLFNQATPSSYQASYSGVNTGLIG